MGDWWKLYYTFYINYRFIVNIEVIVLNEVLQVLKGNDMLPESIKQIFSENNGPLSREELVLGESIKSLEIAISNELNNCLYEIDQETLYMDPELSRLTAELQCALDIVQCARTLDERKRVYEILMSLGKSPK